MLFLWEERREPSYLTLRRLSSTRRGPRRPPRSILRGRRRARLKQLSWISSLLVVFLHPSPPDPASAAGLTDTCWKARSWSST